MRTSPATSSRSDRGFTLLEVTVVLLILSIVSAAAVLHARGRIEIASLTNAVGQVKSFDRLTRAFSREQDRPVRVMVSPASGRLRRVDESGLRTIGTEVNLPEGFAFAEVRIAGKPSTSAETTIGCSRLGLTASYAVKVAGPSGQSKWVLFAGFSGEAREFDDDQGVQDILSAAGGHAD